RQVRTSAHVRSCSPCTIRSHQALSARSEAPRMGKGGTARFKVDPRLATLLGEGYRSSEHALKELVDNAWDADAAHVSITLPAPMSADPIVIVDDGSGMTEAEVRGEYLVVAN